MEEADKIFEEIEKLVSDEKDEKNFGPLINGSVNIEKKIMGERVEFLNSLDNLLSSEQIAKVILFVRKFKKDVRDLLIERGRRRFLKEENKR